MSVAEEVLEFYLHTCRIAGANQESLHQEAYELRKALSAAGDALAADLVGNDDFTVVWADSATGIFNQLKNTDLFENRRVLSSRLEHPALAALVKKCSSKPCYLNCSSEGVLEKKGGEFDIALLTAVQSEIGIVQDLPGIFELLPPECIRFVDAVQMAGKMDMRPLGSCADLIAISGIKFGSPGGAALLVRKNRPWSGKLLETLARGRHPEYTAPRVYPPAALACAFAFNQRIPVLESSLEKMRQINAFLREALKDQELKFTVSASLSSPYILHCTLPGKQGAVVVRSLSERNIMAGAGSACASESSSGSPALRALGFGKRESFSGLRLSFGFGFTQEEAEFLAENLLSVLKNY